MAAFVVCRELPRFGSQVRGLALRPHEHFVLGVLEVFLRDSLRPSHRRVDGGVVHHGREIGARVPRGPARQDLAVDVPGHRQLRGVELQYLGAAADVGQRDGDVAVEPAGPRQRLVEELREVRGGEHDHPRVRVEPVELHQQLVEREPHRLLLLRLPGAADGVDLVDEDEARGPLLGRGEEVPHPPGPDPDVHLLELAPRGREEGHPGLARDRLRQERLPGARGAHQQDPAGEVPPQPRELLGLLEELDDLLELHLRLLAPLHVVEADLAHVDRRDLVGRLCPPYPGEPVRHEIAARERGDAENDDEAGG
mmetsp:Transcript_11758/g.28981  ORF Transcript_11758/g.28981 Transcript_11758/m.28981 type:complete len:310 (+) Transcript_11758:716-1645(+)